MLRNSGFRIARSLCARGTLLSKNAIAPTATTSATSSSSLGVAPTTSPLQPQQQQRSSFSTMFCRQCEQTQDGVACKGSEGVCGKSAETSACQDALLHVVKHVGVACTKARAENTASPELLQKANIWTLASTFSTLTNVNFSEERIAEYTWQGEELLKELNADPVFPNATTVQALEQAAEAVSVPARQEEMGNIDAFSLNEIASYGLKGLCAYAMHVHQLRQDIAANNPDAPDTLDPEIFVQIHEILTKLASTEPDMDGLLQTALSVGALNAQVLAALDGAHAELLGVPEPTQVRTTPVEGKCILVSGHDMVDLYHLLKQTEGTGVQVYTHGEMMPAHSYPKLKAFPHLAGNYGTAWQNQNFEFAAFPGPVIVTTNCIIKPRKHYQDRIYTMNEVGYDGVKHIENRDFSGVIAQAQQESGFDHTFEPASYQTVGFNHRVVLPLAGQIIEAAQTGTLSRILLIGGCDGSQWNRSYFTDLAEEAPDDALILTLGCAKNRLIHSEKLMKEHNEFVLPNGTTIPRVLDMGQCNDSYSAVVVATELAKALDCSVNDLPLSLALSHLEQKAAAVLLTLLSMGVQNIRLGPSLPAYVTPNVWKVLQETYNMKPTVDAKEDLTHMMEGN